MNPKSPPPPPPSIEMLEIVLASMAPQDIISWSHLFIIKLEALSREIWSGSPEKLLYAEHLTLFTDSLEHLKGRLEAWKRILESKALRSNAKKTKKMIISEINRKVTEEGKFPGAVCRKSIDINSILCKFYRCWVHKRCGVRGKLKEH